MRSLSVLTVVPVLVLSACGHEPVPLEVVSIGITLDGTQGNPPPYFVTDVCAKDGEHTVTITGVRAEESTGRGAEFQYVVNWSGGDDAVSPGGYAELLPSAFVAAKGSRGTVNECGSGEQAQIGLVFPEMTAEAVGVRRLVVHYESDGEAGTVTGDVTFVHCGTNQVIGGEGSCTDPTGG